MIFLMIKAIQFWHSNHWLEMPVVLAKEWTVHTFFSGKVMVLILLGQLTLQMMISLSSFWSACLAIYLICYCFTSIIILKNRKGSYFTMILQIVYQVLMWFPLLSKYFFPIEYVEILICFKTRQHLIFLSLIGI